MVNEVRLNLRRENDGAALSTVGACETSMVSHAADYALMS